MQRKKEKSERDDAGRQKGDNVKEEEAEKEEEEKGEGPNERGNRLKR